MFDDLANQQNGDRIKDFAAELQTGAEVEAGDIATRSKKVDYVGRKISDGGGGTTDIDNGLKNGDIVEVKEHGANTPDSAKIRLGEEKLDKLGDAHAAGEIDLNNGQITFVTSDPYSSKVKQQLRSKAQSVAQDRGITNLNVNFDTRS